MRRRRSRRANRGGARAARDLYVSRPLRQQGSASMSKLFEKCKCAALVAVLLLSFSLGQGVLAQHEGHDMQRMNKPKPKTKQKSKRRTVRTRKRTVRRNRQPVQKRDQSATPAMIPTPHVHTPGMT